VVIVVRRGCAPKPDLAEAHYNLGIVLEQAGRLQDAVEHYEQALRINPKMIEAQNGLARLRAAR
jgi:protein O-GlcNAc transferase